MIPFSICYRHLSAFRRWVIRTNFLFLRYIDQACSLVTRRIIWATCFQCSCLVWIILFFWGSISHFSSNYGSIPWIFNFTISIFHSPISKVRSHLYISSAHFYFLSEVLPSQCPPYYLKWVALSSCLSLHLFSYRRYKTPPSMVPCLWLFFDEVPIYFSAGFGWDQCKPQVMIF